MTSDHIIQETGLIVFVALITGTFGGRFDPLPTELRSVISSNQLGEGPPIFHEYHALLPNFRGDYGIKSNIVKAVGKDPLYTGSDTLIVPLYIPEGAIPLRIHDRSPRSGKPSSSTNFRFLGGPSPSLPGESSRGSINRPIIRRIGSPNRRGHVAIRKIPTPPPSIIRPWMKRRHGVSSTKPPDNVEEVKISKILSHVADFHKQIQRSRYKGASSKGKILSVSKAKKDHDLHPKSSVLDTTSAASTVSESLKLKNFNATATTPIIAKTKATPSSVFVTKKTEVLTSIRPTISPVRKIKKILSNSSLENSDGFFGEKKPVARTVISRTSTDIKRRRVRPNPRKTDRDTLSNLSSTTTPKPDTKRITPIVQQEEVTNSSLVSSTTQNTQVNTAKRGKGKIRLPVWPRGRQPTLLKGLQTRKEREQIKTKSIIDRVLNSAVNQSSRNDTTEKHAKLDKHSAITLDTELNTGQAGLNAGDIESNGASGKNSMEDKKNSTNNSANDKDHSLSIQQEEPKNSYGSIQLFPRIKGHPIFASSTLVPIPDEITKEVDEKLKGMLASTNSKKVTNYITTSTPKMSWPLINTRKRKRKRKPYGEIIRRFNIPSKNSSKLVFSPSAPITTPKLKTAEDIVLEKLSSLMTASAESGAQSLEDIARDIEIINEELAALGIHIIDAEFDGHKLSLNQPQITAIQNHKIPTAYQHLYVDGQTNKPNGDLPLSLETISDATNFSTTLNVTFDNVTTVRVSSSEAFFVPHQIEAPDISLDNWRPSIVTVKPTLSKDQNTTYLQVSTVRSNIATSKTRSTTVSVIQTFAQNNGASEPPVVVDIGHNSSHSSHTTARNIPLVNIPVSQFRPMIKSSGESLSPPKTHQYPSTRENVNEANNNVPDESTTLAKDLYVVEYQRNQWDTGVPMPDTNIHLDADKLPMPTVRTAFTADTKDDKVDVSEYLAEILGDNERSNIESVEATKTDNNAILVEIGPSATSKKTDYSSSYFYFLSLIGLLPLCAIAFVLYNRRHKSSKKSLPEREEKSEGHTPPINHVRSSMHAGTLDALPAYVFEKSDNRTSPWELPRSKLRITSVIGEGNFGMVWKAEARNLCDWEAGGGPTVLVAVKGVKENAGQKEKADLLRELSIMQHLGQHSNIVTLLGCCTSHEPYYLVMEFVMFGKLLTFLRESRSKNNYFNFSSDTEHLTSKDLTRFAYQIASGCEYLQTKGIIHRDLAARNILVDHNKTCKIADFGLARSIKDTDSDIYEQKSKGPLPIRWMALESLYMNIFTHKSDVWSFGILGWEIVTLGSTPYPGISAREVMRRVREGYRLERPEHCRGEFYQILSSCWNQDLNNRPTFAKLKTDLRELLDHQEGWIDLENFQESSYYSMHQNNEERL